MLKILIVYDSVFGNTALIAETMGKSLDDTYQVDVKHIDQFDHELLKKIDMLIIGSPTRAFSPTKKISSALKKLTVDELNRLKISVFDTRINMSEVNNKILKSLEKKQGYASDSMIKILKKKGFDITNGIGAFYVEGTKGPLEKDEIEKAAQWVNKIVDLCRH